MDYFLARYYSPAQGRFTSPDPENAGSIFDDPQSWNGFAYARNNPLVFVDPSGQEYVIVHLVDGDVIQSSLTDQEFYDLRDKFIPNGQSLVFTGDPRGFFGGGSIYSAQGEYLGSYQQISIDDPAHNLAYEVRERFRDPETYKRAAVGALIGIAISKAGRGGTRGPARISPGSLPASEEAAALKTIQHIDAGTKPAGAVGTKWGTKFFNKNGDLPGPSGAASPYREYRVASGPEGLTYEELSRMSSLAKCTTHGLTMATLEIQRLSRSGDR